MKAIKRIIISLVVIVAVLGVVVIGGYIYVRSAYGISTCDLPTASTFSARQGN